MTNQRKAILIPVAALAVASLLGCSADQNLVGDELPTPILVAGEPLAICATPSGAATIEVFPNQSSLVLNAGAQPPVDRVELAGVVSGLSMGERVLVVVSSIDSTCPFGRAFATGIDEDGEFEAFIDVSAFEDFRVAALVTDGTVDSIACDGAQDCLTTADAAVILAVSSTIEVRID